MRYEALIAAVLVLSQVGGSPANAEPRGSATASQVNAGAPHFNAAETLTVGRNELLRELIETDPWLVRHILDAVAERGAKDEAFDADMLVNTAFYAGGIRSGAEAKTAAASVELIELLRRVKDEKADKQGSKQSRSAKGSVELLESLKKAKKEKDGGK